MIKLIQSSFPAIVLAFVLIPLVSFHNLKEQSSLPSTWEKLGDKRVDFKADRDDILVGAREGYFDGLQIRMKRGSINMLRMQVIFGNGETTDFPLKSTFNEGDQSRVIELPHNRRMIRSVTFWYETTNPEGKRSIVELWGRH